jgi:membrane fusion protein, multidrug efflux system
MALATIAVLGGGAYFYVWGGRYQSTDDAYAQATTVAISANVAGRVSEIGVRDDDLVQRGATLFKLDDAPFRIAVSDAAAHLADSRLQIESLKSTYASGERDRQLGEDRPAGAGSSTVGRRRCGVSVAGRIERLCHRRHALA